MQDQRQQHYNQLVEHHPLLQPLLWKPLTTPVIILEARFPFGLMKDANP